jgi:4'-phosphopantetheinyl transferase
VNACIKIMRDAEPERNDASMTGAAPGNVFAWWMACVSPSPALTARWQACLSDAERAAADRFHFEVDRSTYLAAHWLLRHALTSIAGIPPQSWRFTARQHGKPDVDTALGLPDLQFNLSHTRGFVACAISIANAVGIDVEAASRNPDIEVADRFFSPHEVAILRAMPAERQPETFLRFWTLKEALIKATGEGLSRALDSFSFALDPVSIRFHPDDSDAPALWSFIEHRPTPGHLLALAVRHAPHAALRIALAQVDTDHALTRGDLPRVVPAKGGDP